MNRITKWVAGTVAALVCVGIALPVLAQRAGAEKNDANRAKEMAQLIQQGQLSLRDACALAERHVRGTALTATCDIQPGSARPTERPMERERPGGGPDADQQEQPQKPGEPPKAAGNRLVYEVCCFAGDKIQAVRVDGLEKRVIDAKEKPNLPGGHN